MKYNIQLLQEFCKENNIKLLEDYTNKIFEYSSKIILECKQCNTQTEKCFAYMIKTKNALCKRCITINSLQKQKETMMKRYGVEHPSQSDIIKLKIKQGFIDKYGVDNPSKTIEVQNKMKKTNLERYGVEFLVHNKEIKDKMIKTNLEKYGVENPLQNNDIKTKVKNTIIQKYGVDNVSKSIDFQNKMKNTNLIKYGVEFPLQNININTKMKKTNLEKYGFENPLQNAEISHKHLLSSYNTKQYNLPSGSILMYQGFENFALNELIKEGVQETDIITSRIQVPELCYIDNNNKKRRHYVDIFIPSKNICIEVKSEYTITLESSNIFLKQEAAKVLGYNYEIWVYNRKGNKVECYK
jgi:hypothetical protein